MSFFGNRGGGRNSSGDGSTSRSTTLVVSNIAERDALLAVKNGSICMVQDASSDTTVGEGFAVYQRIGESWIKISDENIMRIQSTENIKETDNKRFVTTQEKEMIHETKVRVDGIETILDESVMIQESNTAPSDINVLWIAE